MKAKLYSPVFVDIWEYDDDEGPIRNELSQRSAARHKDEIQAAMHKYRSPEEAERGLMAYYDEPDTINEKVRSMFIDVEIHGGKLWCVTTLDVAEPLEPWELETLRNYITGQFSDGWGEGFEQQNIRVEDGELNVHLWKHGELFLDTREQFSNRTGIALLPEDFDQVVEEAVVAEVGAEIFAEHRQRLVERAGQNWDDFRNAPLTTTSEDIYHKAVAVVGYRDAFIFIKDYGDFTPEQVNSLLKFANPVGLVADYLDPKSDIEDMPGILASIMDDLENLKQHYAPAADASAPDFEELERRLQQRLADNFAVYKRDMLDLSKEELFKSAAEIAAVSEVYEHVAGEHSFKEPEVQFLLNFQNPLEVLSDGRSAQLYDVRDVIDWVMNDQERLLLKSGYGLMPDEPGPAPADPELSPRKAIGTGEKPSVMERIRLAAKEARERPAAPKDAPGRKKPEPEL